ncbi:MAG: Fur family transcriptional regulator [Candidatus Methylophosphatis roskildensis]
MTHDDSIAARIAACGGRVTRPRAAVFEILLGAGRALTHEEIAAELAARGIAPDRVTLYRNLDWLVANGLAHRVSGADRVSRFNAAGDEQHGHAHFQCDQCNAVFCLEALQPAVAASLPAGFSLDHAELTLHGRCPKCR